MLSVEHPTTTLDGRPVAVKVSGHPDADANGVFYLHLDHYHLGSVVGMTDASGALVADSIARFLPFGAYRSDGSQPVDGNGLSDRGFTGHYENRELGLTYMQARYYAPELRRFISADILVPPSVSIMGETTAMEV